jgi:hypothetical protein
MQPAAIDRKSNGISGARSFGQDFSLLWRIGFLPALFLLPALATDVHSACMTKSASRTFVQLWRQDALRTEAKWEDWFKNLDNLGFTEIIAQWSSYGPVSFYDDPGANRECSPSLKALIQAAGRHRKKIWLGLHYDPSFWQAIGEEPADPQGYLKDRLQDFARRLPFLLRAIKNADPKGEVVCGWYISDEIDDQNWQDPAHCQALLGYLGSLRQHLRKAKAEWPVLVSGFSNGNLTPAQWTAFWNNLLAQTRIDGLLFQDGIGAGKLTLQQLEGYLKSFASSFIHADRTFGVIVELFQINTHKESAAGLQAADMARVNRQLSLACMYSRLPVTVFSAPDYLVADRDDYRRNLQSGWQADMAACKRTLNQKAGHYP